MDEDRSLTILDAMDDYCKSMKKTCLEIEHLYERTKRTGGDENCLLLLMRCVFRRLDQKFRAFWFDSEAAETLIRQIRPNWDYFTPLDFEVLVQSMLYLVENRAYLLTKGSYDRGIDLMYEESVFFGEEKAGVSRNVVQCKLYRGSVSVSEVRDFYGVLTANVAEGYLFTTGSLTKSGTDFITVANQSSYSNAYRIVEKNKFEVLLTVCRAIADLWDEYDALDTKSRSAKDKFSTKIKAPRHSALAIIQARQATQQPKLFL